MKTKSRFLKVLVVTVAGIALGGASALAKTKPAPVKAPAAVVFPAAPEQPRIQFLRTVNGSNVFTAGNPFGNRFPGYVPRNKRKPTPS